MQLRSFMLPGALLLLLSILTLPALAQDKEAEEKQDEKVELKFDSMTDLKKDYDKKYAAFLKEARAAGRDREKMMAARELMPNMADYTEQMMGFIKEDPTEANIMWAMSKQVPPGVSKKLRAIVLEKFIESKNIMRLLGRTRPSEEIIMQVYEKSPHDEIKATMLYTLIGMKTAAQARADDDEKEALTAKVDELTNILTSEFADVKDARGVSFAARLEGQKFAAENLVIGKPVPDIVGEDVDGVEFKLSDYKGKVVVIDFWGDW